MLVLESEQHAKARGARIYAEFAGCGMTSDAGHITRPDVTGITNTISNALQHAGICTEQVDYINAHGTATELNDAAETKAIRQAFGEHAYRLAVSATKSMHGHALGASSALELVATTLATYHGNIPPTANFTVADEECDLDYVPHFSRRGNIEVALINNSGFGGRNSSILIKKWNGVKGEVS